MSMGPAGRLTDLVSLGALTSLVPRGLLDEAIEAHGCHRVVSLLIALCLVPDDDYEEVAGKLTGMLEAVPGARWQALSRGPITRAR